MAIKGVLIPTAVSAPLSNKCPEICLTTQVQSNGTEIYCYEGKAWLWANTLWSPGAANLASMVILLLSYA